MEDTAHRAIAVVGVGAILPDAPNAPTFWQNVKTGRYSISDITPDRWDPALYYDPDPKAADKTYSKIGGWVRTWEWNPLGWGLPIPPRVSDAMDDGQKWAVACTREALIDYGFPRRPLDTERTAVILGNAMAGEKHYLTALRIYFPEFAEALTVAPSFAALPAAARSAILEEAHHDIGRRLPPITEDTMPGELSNCIAGRIANLFNFRGPNYVVDAACASAMAAISAAIEGLTQGDFDTVVAGGVDRNMGASAYIKFCKIGALSATGTRPYADGADGFVMGEGAAVFLLKRLSDAERDGDKIYAVIRGIGASSDGKGKGITAPNPVGQRLAVERAWRNAGLSPVTCTMVEGHGTSTRVGDVVEVESLTHVFGEAGLRSGAVALGSVKSNIGHLKAAAGAAGFLKAVLALHEKVLPPSLHFDRPNPSIDFSHCPFFVNTELQPWDIAAGEIRRAALSAFGFGGTNFHMVLEEHVPGRLRVRGNGIKSAGAVTTERSAAALVSSETSLKAPLRGVLVLGADSAGALAERVRAVHHAAEGGSVPPAAPPTEADLRAPQRIAIDYADARELADRSAKALQALTANNPAMWKALRAQGIFRGQGAAPKVAFLYTGQGSQYVNMLAALRVREPIVADTFREADRVMTPLLGKPLSEYIFVDGNDGAAVAGAEEHLRQTAITQPAVLAADIALTRLLASYGITPDMVMGHSLGEYGALVAAGALPFAEALEAVSARGREMTNLSVDDNGLMAAVFGPLADIERILKTIDGYVVIANVNSHSQAVIGGASAAVERAMLAFLAAGFNAVSLPVSHAFHTAIVAPASAPLRRTLERLHLQPPHLPIVANVSGDFYPMGPGVVSQMLDILAQQVASPVQFVKGLHTLHDAGAGCFLEVGPKRALHGFVEDVLGDHPEVSALFTNHPKVGDVAAFNQALCGLYAAGLGIGAAAEPATLSLTSSASTARPLVDTPAAVTPATIPPPAPAPVGPNQYMELGRLFAEVLERGLRIYGGQPAAASVGEPVVITGAALGLPGTERIFDDGNVGRILDGQQFIDVIPTRFRRAMLDKHITRLVKSEAGGPRFESIDSPADVIKLAGRGGAFDLAADFGVPAERVAALDIVTQLAIAAGLDALRDAGIPLVMRYKTTSKGTQLPDRWVLPEALRDDTGVIFASAFPGYDALIADLTHYHTDRARREQVALLESLRTRLAQTHGNGHDVTLAEIDHRIHELHAAIEAEPYVFDRRFLFRILSMGHSQFAEFICARGPNTQINAACASTTQAVVLAEDWIRAGRCRRVIIIAGDDFTSDNMLEWTAAGFLATGAAATDDVVEEAALPFDRRRHGMILGMGAAGIIVESAAAARERGVQPICEVLGGITANSAFHGTRLDVDHICQIMEQLITAAEARWGIRRQQLAPQTVFVSHETYTPARGGSAAAEVHALRKVFGRAADQIVVANTKGFTGHAMGAGIEDIVAVKSLESGIVPPVANFKEEDPELGALNLSKGGAYPVEYALRLGAGFGSQISMTLLRHVPSRDGSRPNPDAFGYAYRIADPDTWQKWLTQISGLPAPRLEVVNRTLRVQDQRPGTHAPQPAAAQPAQPAAPRPAPPAIAPAPPVTPAAETDAVKDRVLALFAEKTGYPPDMLDPDLDLEADLGIDTVKQAEMFAAIRETYDIPRDDTLKLRDFPTLQHVVQFVRDRRPDLAAAVTRPPLAQPPPAGARTPTEATPAADPISDRVLALFGEKTGYPPDMLDPDLDLEADLGIDTVKQAEMFAAIRETYDIPRDDTLKLRDFPTLKHVIQFVRDRRPDLAPAVAASPVAPGSAPGDVKSPPAPTPADPVKDRILALFAEKTGYPPDMLDPDLDLEADLGIDTVKQAEMFAAIREAYGIARDDTLKLRDFPTLKHVMQFVRDRRPDLAPPDPACATSNDDQVTPESAKEGRTSGDVTDTIPRRVPVPVLRPPLAFCKSTGVQLGPQSRVVVMPDRGGVAAALVGRLQQLGVESLLLEPTADARAVGERVAAWAAAGPVQGVYWLPALDHEGDLGTMDLAVWRAALALRVKLLYTTMRVLYEQIAAPGTFLVSATLLGGQHGYDEAGALAPLGGAVVGFAKTYKRERTAALVKAVDFEAAQEVTEVAQRLVDETLTDPGVVEVGYQCGQRWSVGLQERPVGEGHAALTLTRDTVFVITGAAGGIVSAITADLAAASGGTFYLLDKVPEPDPANPDLGRLRTDKETLKRDLFERIKARGERATPALVDRELAALERAHAALDAIHAVRQAGGTVYYCPVDLTDADAVARVFEDVRTRSGRVDVLLHAAGLEISRFLPDKEPREFDLVFDVKSDGWFNLLHALGDLPVQAAVVFSSIAGRFGNAGQSDYSAANDLLCKSIANFRTTRPDTRGIAIDWTAWASIGMASRGSIPKMMELAGIDMLPPEAGIPIVRRELTAVTSGNEVVIGQRLGILLNEWDSSGGLDPSQVVTQAGGAPGPMITTLIGMGLHAGLTAETTLDPRIQPFLHDHQIDGTPVLPGVMGLEAFAELAAAVLPDWHVAVLENVNFLAPFKFYRNEPRTLTINALVYADGPDAVAECRLLGSRALPSQAEPQVTTHFTARVRLTRRAQQAATTPPPNGLSPTAAGSAEIYHVYFHGPAYQVLNSVWRDGNHVVGVMTPSLPANHSPAELPTRIAPRLVELCFQTAGIWELGTTGRLGLPQHIDRVDVTRPLEGGDAPVYAVVSPHPEAGSVDAQVVDAAGQLLLAVHGYRTVALPGAVDPDGLLPLQRAVQ